MTNSGKFLNPVWSQAASKDSDPELMHRILLTAKTPEGFRPEVDLMNRFDRRAAYNVLDFGCGLGRNLKWMSENTSWRVTGYDSPEMLRRAATWLGPLRSGVGLSGDWVNIRETNRFDLVFATIVFQHIQVPELRDYLKELSRITGLLVVYGRRFNDDGHANTWRIISEWFDLRSQAGGALVLDGADEEHSLAFGTAKPVATPH